MKGKYITRHLARMTVWILAVFVLQVQAADSEWEVGITGDLPYVMVNHRGIPVRIQRIQDTGNRLVDDFSKTSRPCPPFCIHPLEAAPGVHTLGELELLEFLKSDVETGHGLLIDARMPDWYESETIPGAINIPFVIFTTESGKRDKILSLLGAVRDETGRLDFSAAQELALFCNGPWCDQSPRAIKGLISAGYPPEKLNYFRGGMQSWKMFGLTTVLPTSHAVGESKEQ